MRRLLLAVTGAILLAGATAAPSLSAGRSVKVGDNFFVKDGGVHTVTVKKGDTVKWNFTGNAAHNVTVKSGPAKFHSKTMSSGSFSKKLTKKGLYTLYCTIHGASDQSMKLRVK
jgi:plastocyanin